MPALIAFLRAIILTKTTDRTEVHKSDTRCPSFAKTLMPLRCYIVDKTSVNKDSVEFFVSIFIYSILAGAKTDAPIINLP